MCVTSVTTPPAHCTAPTGHTPYFESSVCKCSEKQAQLQCCLLFAANELVNMFGFYFGFFRMRLNFVTN